MKYFSANRVFRHLSFATRSKPSETSVRRKGLR